MRHTKPLHQGILQAIAFLSIAEQHTVSAPLGSLVSSDDSRASFTIDAPRFSLDGPARRLNGSSSREQSEALVPGLNTFVTGHTALRNVTALLLVDTSKAAELAPTIRLLSSATSGVTAWWESNGQGAGPPWASKTFQASTPLYIVLIVALVLLLFDVILLDSVIRCCCWGRSEPEQVRDGAGAPTARGRPHARARVRRQVGERQEASGAAVHGETVHRRPLRPREARPYLRSQAKAGKIVRLLERPLALGSPWTAGRQLVPVVAVGGFLGDVSSNMLVPFYPSLAHVHGVSVNAVRCRHTCSHARSHGGPHLLRATPL